MTRLGRSTPPPPRPEDIVGVVDPSQAVHPGPGRDPYNVPHLSSAEDFLRGTVQDLFQLRSSLWFPSDHPAFRDPAQLEAIRHAQRRFRNQIRGLIGALRLVHHARMPAALEPLLELQNAK
jgi:hypothetical protein